MKVRFLIASVLLFLAYANSYLWYRANNTRVWARDGQAYVIFSAKAEYYFFRPLSYVDAWATGRRAHLGEHQR